MLRHPQFPTPESLRRQAIRLMEAGAQLLVDDPRAEVFAEDRFRLAGEFFDLADEVARERRRAWAPGI